MSLTPPPVRIEARYQADWDGTVPCKLRQHALCSNEWTWYGAATFPPGPVRAYCPCPCHEPVSEQ